MSLTKQNLTDGNRGLGHAGSMNDIFYPLFFLQQPIGELVRLTAVTYSKRYSKVLEYEYRVKTAALDTLKRYSILSLTLYLE
jgi:hypothetical protein